MSEIHIQNTPIGFEHPTFIIAEIGQAHDGSLGTAHAYIDAVAKTGANAIKFQTHFAEHESTLDEPFRVKFSQQDATRFDYWQRMEFTPEAWAGLAEHANQVGLIFLSSAFSIQAVELLEKLAMPAWKVGSGEYKSSSLLEAMRQTGKPILLSTGMSTWKEITTAADNFQAHNTPYAIFQCTSQYPTPLENVGLNNLDAFREHFNCPIGLSDHSGTPSASQVAIARNVDLLEVHVTFDKGLFGPDVPASLTLSELQQLCQLRDDVQTFNTHPVDKDQMANTLSTMRGLFTKSLAVTQPLKAGDTLTADKLTFKKPGTGITEQHLNQIIGSQLARDVSPMHLLSWEDIHHE